MPHPRFRPFSISLVTLGFILAGPSFAADTQVLHIRADSWMPFNGDPANEKPGYVVELLRAVFEPQGIKVDYQIMPWTNALKAAATAEIDGVIGANKKEAASLVVGAESIAEPKFALFVRRDSTWKYESLRSLQSVKLGAIESYNYWDSLDGYLKKSPPAALKFYGGDTPLVEAIADLSAGKIDVLVESVVVFYWAVKGTGKNVADFRIAYTEQSDPLYVAFSPTEQGRKQARLFDRGLRVLRENGRFDAILEKYGLGRK
jgi:polar amino acid transport system substrate-binding protein